MGRVDFKQEWSSYVISRCIKSCALAGLTLSLAVFSSGALSRSYDADEPGGRDNPIVSRYAGSILVMYGDDDFGSAQLVVLEKDKLALRPVEGRISNRIYLAPKGSSPLAVFRNYQQALASAGFETLLACETAKCEKLGDVQQLIYSMPRSLKWTKGDNWTSIFNSGNQPLFHYLSAKKVGTDGSAYVQIGLVGSSESDQETHGRTKILVQVVEPANVDQGKVSVVDAKTIGDALKRDGKIALYGILFDTNKANIKVESNPTLEEMVKALKADPTLKVYIVGHTDNEGVVEANLALSQKRADAVVETLSKRFGIATDRLQARGVANFVPVASNLSPEGRAKNRRVEMVVR